MLPFSKKLINIRVSSDNIVYLNYVSEYVSTHKTTLHLRGDYIA